VRLEHIFVIFVSVRWVIDIFQPENHHVGGKANMILSLAIINRIKITAPLRR